MMPAYTDHELEHLGAAYRRHLVAEYLGIPFRHFLREAPRMQRRFLEAAEEEAHMPLLPAQAAVRDRLDRQGWHRPAELDEPAEDPLRPGSAQIRGGVLVEPVSSARYPRRRSRRGHPRAHAHARRAG